MPIVWSKFTYSKSSKCLKDLAFNEKSIEIPKKGAYHEKKNDKLLMNVH